MPRRNARNAAAAAAAAAAAEDDPEPQMCSLSEPRRRVVSERPQALLPLEGLPLRQLSAGGGAPARHGGASRPAATASGGGEERTTLQFGHPASFLTHVVLLAFSTLTVTQRPGKQNI